MRPRSNMSFVIGALPFALYVVFRRKPPVNLALGAAW